MESRAIKTVVVMVLAGTALTAGGWYALGRYLEECAVARTKSDLQTLGQAAEKYAAEFLDIEHWEQVRDSDQFLAPVIPVLECGRTVWHDAWDQPYLLDRRDESDRIVFVLRSSHPLKDGTLGVGFVISRADGKMTERRELWR